MGKGVFGFADLAIGLTAKLHNREFREDLEQLVLHALTTYEIDEAADLIMERLGVYLDGAPTLADIEGGAWRR
jgi:lipoate-protein ligase B